MRAVIIPLVGAAMLAAGCAAGSGGGNAAIPAAPPVIDRGAATVTLRIDAPAPASASTTRRREYFSAASESISIQVNSGTPDAQNVTPGSPNCTTPTLFSPLTCDVVINAPPGKDTFVIKSYDQPNTGAPPVGGYAGSVLSASTFAFTVVAGQNNVITTTLDGYPASLTITPLPDSPYFIGSPTSGFVLYGTSANVFVNAYDADGYLIIGLGSPKITLHSTANVAVTPPSSSAAPVWTIKSMAFDTAGTLTATATPPIGSGTSTVASITAPILARHRALYVADPSKNIYEYYDGRTTPAATQVAPQTPNGVMVDSQGRVTVTMATDGAFQFPAQAFAFPAQSVAGLYYDGLMSEHLTGVCTDGQDDPYFVDGADIVEFAPAGQNPTTSHYPAIFLPDLRTCGSARDGIWVLDGSSIEHYAPATLNPDQQWFTEGSAISLASDPTGDVFVGYPSGVNYKIGVYLAGVPKTNEFTLDKLPLSAKPVSLSTDLAGNLYVADGNSNNVYVFSPPFTSSSAPTTLHLGGGLKNIAGIAIYPPI